MKDLRFEDYKSKKSKMLILLFMKKHKTLEKAWKK